MNRNLKTFCQRLQVLERWLMSLQEFIGCLRFLLVFQEVRVYEGTKQSFSVKCSALLTMQKQQYPRGKIPFRTSVRMIPNWYFRLIPGSRTIADSQSVFKCFLLNLATVIDLNGLKSRLKTHLINAEIKCQRCNDQTIHIR